MGPWLHVLHEACASHPIQLDVSSWRAMLACSSPNTWHRTIWLAHTGPGHVSPGGAYEPTSEPFLGRWGQGMSGCCRTEPPGSRGGRRLCSSHSWDSKRHIPAAESAGAPATQLGRSARPGQVSLGLAFCSCLPWSPAHPLPGCPPSPPQWHLPRPPGLLPVPQGSPQGLEGLGGWIRDRPSSLPPGLEPVPGESSGKHSC